MRSGERFQRARRLHRAFLFLFSAVPLGLFVYFTAPGIRAGFTHDDLMNIHGARSQPLLATLGDIAAFFRYSHTYRPTTALVYRVVFECFGFDPLPYRAACYLLLAVNIGLVAHWARRMTGQREVAMLTAAIHCYHGRLSGLYVSTGFLYDLVCFTIYFATFGYYVRLRRRGPLGPRQVALWIALYAATLGSKEMAVSLPPILLVWELFIHRDRSRHALVVPVIGAVMTAAFIGGRLLGETALLSMSSYRPDIRWTVFVDRCSYFLTELNYGRPWHHGAFGWTVLGVALTAAVTRSRQIAFGLMIALIGVLPIAFIDQRGLSQAYIPMAGIAYSFAVAASKLGQLLWWIFGVLPGSGCLCFPIRRFAITAATAVLLVRWHLHNGRVDFDALLEEGRFIGSVACQLRCALPKVEPGSRILFRKDPFPQYDWNSLFLVRNVYDNNSIEVFHASRPAEDRRYTHELEFSDGRLLDCTRTPCP